MSCSRQVRTRALAFLACAGLIGVAPKAHALELGLEIDGCTDLPEQRVQELLTLELTADVARPRAPGRSAALVSVSCAGDDVRILVTDSTTNKAVSRTFTLTEREPDVRARAVALAAAELVITSWMELVLANPPERPKPAPAWVDDNRRAATSVVREHTEQGTHVDALLAFATLGGTFRARPGARGGGLRLSVVWGETHLASDADLSVTFDDAHTPLGDVRVDTWSLGLRPALRLAAGHWIGTLGVGARLGLARLEGSAFDPSAARGHVVAGTWGGPLAHANVGFSFAHLSLRLGAESGFALRRVTGTVDGREHAGVRGPWFLTTLGFGWGA